MGGVRYWHLSTNIEFRPGILPAAEIHDDRNWVDAIGGLRGRARLSPRWSVTGLGDLGGGGSDFTYQLFGGIGASVSKRVSLVFGYRYLAVNYRSNGFIFDVALKGPVPGAGFRF